MRSLYIEVIPLRPHTPPNTVSQFFFLFLARYDDDDDDDHIDIRQRMN